ncbi:Ergothioneine biosynthesis protein 1 [Beauveria bassiana]|nr:Ergothioneine biosynthesis protein 1 [Beauveria bassiana]KAH8711754.1 Ergothioneine biosynthesis protein 1 [Beauveria bassiana]
MKTNRILDIGGSDISSYNRALLNKKLLWSQEPFATIEGHVKRVLPTSVIYGNKGLELWSSITYLPSYYQTRGETALLVENSGQLAAWIQRDSFLIDLGCGDIRKLTPLLRDLDRLQKPIHYCPLDLSRESIALALEQTNLSLLSCISVTGLWGSFEEGLDWANRNCGDRPRIFLSLGSMLGNDHFADAVARLKWLRSAGLRSELDMILLTMDGTKDMEKIRSSYDDAEGFFTQMILQGFKDSNDILGDDWYQQDDWNLLRRLTRNPTMHRFVLQAKHTVQCPTKAVTFRQGDEIDCYEGFKYSPEEMAEQFKAAGLKISVSQTYRAMAQSNPVIGHRP